MVVKNIIFDFGGVFIHVDYQRTENAFVEAGIASFRELYSQQAASPLFENLETGKMGEHAFYDALRDTTGLSLENDRIFDCWNAMIGRYYPEAIEKLEQLRGKYRLFLFSNTNVIHYNFFRRIHRQQFGSDNFNDLFEKAYYSHEIGLRKPHPEAYKWVLQNAGLNAAETLFIDDTQVNIEGASEAGLQTIFLKPPMKMWELDL